MASRGRFEDDLEAEALAERRIINAKKVDNWAKVHSHLNKFITVNAYMYSVHILSRI